MNIIVGANCIDSIVAPKITTPNGQMVGFHIGGKIKNYVEFGAVDQ